MYNIDWNDKSCVVNFIRTNPMAIAFAPDFIRSDRDIVLIAVTGNGNALTYANQQFSSDLEIVQIALKTDGMAYLCLSDEMQHDYNIIKTALAQNPEVASFIPDDLKTDPRILTLFEEYNADPDEHELYFLQKEMRFNAFVEDMKSLQDNTEEREHDLEMLTDKIEWAWEH